MKKNMATDNTPICRSKYHICGWIVFFFAAYGIISIQLYEHSDPSKPPEPRLFNSKGKEQQRQPHIIYILADDLGWNDLGYHGSRFKTPTIDRLAAEGVKLEKFYVNSLCSPSRAALMTGRQLTHLGLQHLHIDFNQARGLPLGVSLLPQALNQHGYRSYMVGKWHLGFFRPQYLPHNRGFHRHFGIYTGQAGHTNRELSGSRYALVEDGVPFWENTTYDTHLYINKSKQYIDDHLASHSEKPLFLYLSFQAVHAPMTVPERYTEPYKKIAKNKRLAMAGMVACMDEGISNLTQHLKNIGIWDNTVLFFSTDNGGHAVFGARNKPLRGGKGSLYEGGVRGVAFATGKGIQPGRVSHELIHLIDIFPTLLSLAQTGRQQHTNATAPPHYMKQLQGYDVWPTISSDAPSPRSEIVLNIDPIQPRWGKSLFPDLFDTRVRAAIIHKQWKLLTGFVDWGFNQGSLKEKRFFNERYNGTPSAWLYNLEKDPYEKHNVFHDHPAIVQDLLKRLSKFNETAEPFQGYHRDRNWNPEWNHRFVLPWQGTKPNISAELKQLIRTSDFYGKAFAKR